MMSLLTPMSVYGEEEEKLGLDPLAELDKIDVRIEGDNFSFDRDEGILVIEGNVTVTAVDFSIKCESLHLISDGREKPVIYAYPDVTVMYGEGLAEFHGGEFHYDFNTNVGGCGNVVGVIHLDPEKIDIELEVPMDIHLTASEIAFAPGELRLGSPKINVGNSSRPTLGFFSKEVTAILDEGTIVAAEVDRFGIRLFGVKITLIPMMLRHDFIPGGGIGSTGSMPTIIYDSVDGLGIDEVIYYTFHITPTDESFFTFRLNPWTSDRFYWQTGLHHSFPGGQVGVIYGPERIVDPYEDSQVVWSQPDFRLDYEFGEFGGFRHDVELYWGIIREASRELELMRRGIKYGFHIGPAVYGRWGLSFDGALEWTDYEGGNEYSVFRRKVSLDYDGGLDYDFRLSYFRNSEDGYSPFFYDRVEVEEGVQFKGQLFVSDDWGILTDLEYDLDLELYEHMGFGLVYVFDPIQLGILWDFDDNTISIVGGYPRQFM